MPAPTCLKKITNNRAFSIIELMIGILIFAVVLGFVIYAMFSNRPTYLLEEAKNELIQKQKIVEERIKQDLDAAIRNDGFSKFSMPGLNRIPNSPRASPDESDGIEIIAEKFGGYSGAATNFTQAPDGSLIDITLDAGSPNYQFLTKILQNKDYFSLAMVENTSIVKKSELNGSQLQIEGQLDPNDFKDKTVSFRAAEKIRYTHDPVSKQLLRAVGNSPAEVILDGVEKFQVDYSFHNRRAGGVKLILPAPGYRLSHYLDPSYRNTSLPGTCTAGPGVVCCNPGQECVGPMDARDVRLSLELSVKVSDRVQQLGSTGESRFVVEAASDSNPQTKVVLKNAILFFPKHYSLQSGRLDQTGLNPNCPLNDPRSRCKPECWGDQSGTQFTEEGSHGNYPPTWAGYGDPSSAYCQCGGCVQTASGWNCDNFLPPESNPSSIPSYQFNTSNWPTDSQNVRINKCIEHFNSCDPTGGVSMWQIKHPAGYLACQCLQPSNTSGQVSQTLSPFLKVSDESKVAPGGHSYSWRRYDLTGITADAVLNSIVPGFPQVTNPHICWQWGDCDPNATWLFRGQSGQSVTYPPTPSSNPVTIWQNKCNCRTFQADAEGNETDAPVHRMAVKWDRICNLEKRAGTGGVVCSNTWDSTTDKMKVTGVASGADPSQGFSNALTPEDAALCECLAQSQTQAQARPDFQYNSQWTSDSWSYDFRQGPPMVDPLVGGVPPLEPTQNYGIPAGSIPNFVFGGLGGPQNQSATVSFQGVRGDGSNQTINRVCDSNYCSLRHNWGLALGCCTAALHDNFDVNGQPGSDGIEDWMPANRILPLLNGPQGDYRSYINYCSAHCSGGRWVRSRGLGGGNRSVGEINRVREIITGTGPDTANAVTLPVPLLCGDYNSVPGGGL